MFTNSANFQIPSSKTMISAAASAAATAVLLRSITRGLIPRDLQHYFYFKLRAFLSSFSSQFTIVIQEFDGLSNNELFNAALLYLETINPIQAQRKLRVAMLTKETKISVSVDRNEEIEDDFDGVRVKWKLVSTKIPSRNRKEKCCFELTFHRKYKDWILNNYLPYVLEKSKQVREERKTIKLFTLESYRRRRRGKLWQSVNLNHPATFGTLAMEADVKRRVMEDLERFVERKEFYRKVGKAWKRGYLLFGPPGTGKSSLIAAMANYLNFDVYDLELTEIRSNLELRRLLISVASRSILVVEDIDCSISWKNRIAPDKSTNPRRYGQGTEVTLSGLLNFIDGLWSSCGDERIIIFTTNHKDRFDPALLHPGRMDVHIHMSYCTPCGFKLLTSNYLGTPDNSLVMEVEELLETVKVTPAEVGEQLMKDNNPRTVLRGLIEFLEHKLRVQNHGDTTEAEMGISKKEDNQDLKKNNTRVALIPGRNS